MSMISHVKDILCFFYRVLMLYLAMEKKESIVQRLRFNNLIKC